MVKREIIQIQRIPFCSPILTQSTNESVLQWVNISQYSSLNVLVFFSLHLFRVVLVDRVGTRCVGQQRWRRCFVRESRRGWRFVDEPRTVHNLAPPIKLARVSRKGEAGPPPLLVVISLKPSQRGRTSSSGLQRCLRRVFGDPWEGDLPAQTDTARSSR